MWLPCLKSEVNANSIKTILLVKIHQGGITVGAKAFPDLSATILVTFMEVIGLVLALSHIT